MSTTTVPPVSNVHRDGHLLHLPGGDWTVWRQAVIRGAGFPASLVLSLDSQNAAAAADRYTARQLDVERCRRIALDEITAALATADPDARTRLRALVRRIKRDTVRDEGATPAEVALRSAIAARAAAYTDLVQARESDRVRLEERLRLLLADDRFREAAIWQNRRALGVASRRLLDGCGPPGELRRNAELVAMLVQRYAVKNDSIGFFGPVGWIALVDDPVTLEYRAGATLTSRREVYFESWTIDALAEALNRNPALRPWTTPRLQAGVWLDRDAVYVPTVGQVAVTPEEHRLLALCTGTMTAREIAARHAADAAATDTEAAVFAKLDALVARKLVCWRLEVATQLHPERELAARLGRIGDPALRGECLAAVRRLLDARDRVAAAAGHAAQLDAALEALETTFTGLTAQQPTRRPGQMYAGRTLVYEDCRRACDMVVGGALLAKLGPPLSIFLAAARWVSVQWREAFTRHLRQCHAQLRDAHGTDRLDAQTFVHHAVATAGGLSTRIPRGRMLATAFEEVRNRFQRRWLDLLPVDLEARRVSREVADLSARAAEVFRTAGSGSFGGYLSPDVMIAGASLDAVRRGECHFVLGELHSGNMLLSSIFSAQHEDPDVLRTALERDTGTDPVLVIQYPKRILTARVDSLLARHFWRYELGDDLPGAQPCRSLPAGRLVAVDDGSTIRLRARDGGFDVDAYELFSQFTHREMGDLATEWLPPARHTPRVTIGDLTIAREQWRFTGDELAFTTEADRVVRFAQVRAWARRWNLPRHVFYKVPHEMKPCFLDFDSLVYVDIFVKQINALGAGQQVRITEMLPGIDQTWLVDGQGTRYTSELRMVVRTGNSG